MHKNLTSPIFDVEQSLSSAEATSHRGCAHSHFTHCWRVSPLQGLVILKVPKGTDFISAYLNQSCAGPSVCAPHHPWALSMAQQIQAHNSESFPSLLKLHHGLGMVFANMGVQGGFQLSPWAGAVITTGINEFMREHQWGKYPQVLNLET